MNANVAVRTIQHHIGGELTRGESTRTSVVWDPASGVPQAAVLLAEPSDADRAVVAARKAFDDWRETSLAQRASIMFAFREIIGRHKNELARLVTAEHGKVLEDARGEVIRGLEVIEFACGLPQLLKGEFSDQVSRNVDALSFRQPIGVCVGVTPFNFPVMVPLWMHPVAIATGNTFVLKPSERDPSPSNLIAELYAEAGLPDGVFNVIHGDKVAVDALLNHPDVAGVSFVGSTPVARYVYDEATRHGKRVQALGGAKNHAVVLPDADIEFAAKQLIAAGFGSAGQRCMAVSVAVAVGAAADPLIESVSRKARAIRIGSGLDASSEMGPVVTPEARDRIVDYIGQGVSAGAELVLDGRRARFAGDGFFIGPTIFDRVVPEMSVYRDEIFGPVLGVVRVDSLGDAIELINRNSFANGTAIFTSSGHAARRFQRDVAVGMIGVNVPIPVPMAYYSFGGWKDSLFGDHHIHGSEGIRFYTRAKAVTVRWPTDNAESARMAFPTAS